MSIIAVVPAIPGTARKGRPRGEGAQANRSGLELPEFRLRGNDDNL
jgi:hypothetical protein